MSLPRIFENAKTLFKAPSNSRIFAVIVLARNSRILSSRPNLHGFFIFNSLYFCLRIDYRNSKAEGNISTTNPPPSLDFILSSKLERSFGDLSADTTIFLFKSSKELNVWKNSS